MTPKPNPPEHLPAQPPPGFALPEKRKRDLNPNRWSAFTNDELIEIARCMDYAEQNHPAKTSDDWERIDSQINTELDRRKATYGS